MGREEAVTVDPRQPRTAGSGLAAVARSFRLVAPAVTPLRAADVVAGLAGHVRGAGRDAFRRDVAGLLDGAAAATYTSFRRALADAFRELDASRPGTTVLLPAFCSQDFAEPAEAVGLETRRYDVSAETLAMDVDAVADAIDDETLALVAVNALGYCSPMDAVADLCADRGVALVEALGYAVGSTYDGRRLGTFGDCAALNFQQGKPIPVGGGMVVSRDGSLSLSDEGRPAVSPNVCSLLGYAACAHPRPYYVYAAVAERVRRHDLLSDRVTTHPGSKLDATYEPPLETISDFQGAIGRRVLDRLDEHRRTRARTAQVYDAAFADCERVSRVRPVDGLADHQHVRYPLVADTAALREDLLVALADAGIHATRLYDWPPVDPDRFPEAAALKRGILTLPTHPYVSETDRRIVVETVRDVIAARTGTARG